jgi:hypothetical protein
MGVENIHIWLKKFVYTFPGSVHKHYCIVRRQQLNLYTLTV